MRQGDDGSASDPPPRETDGFLAALGERVRNARARHGMRRRDLAQHSGVSERYLAQLESGRGNVSIVLLRRIAGALATPLAELVREGAEPGPDLALLLGAVERLGPAQLAEARALIEARFGGRSDRGRRIALIGLRGAGKTTTGRLVAAKLGIDFVDMAREIERRAGLALDEIFALSGQAGFRRYEHTALQALLADDDRRVIATGGGIVSAPATFQLLLGGCFTVWLKARPEDHMGRVAAQGDRRPMAGSREAMSDLRRILRSREALYAKADATVDTAGRSPSATAEAVLAAWQRFAHPPPAPTAAEAGGCVASPGSAP